MKLVKNKKILIIVGAVVIVAIGFYNAVGTEISWQDFLSESNLLNEETAIDQPIENEVEVDENLSAGGDEPEVPLYKPVVDYETAVTEAVEKSSPAVVSIIVTKDLPVFESCQQGVFVFPCQTGTASQEVGGGTGFIVTSDGLIITNKHVVNEEGASYTVLTNNGKKYEATVREYVKKFATPKK